MLIFANAKELEMLLRLSKSFRMKDVKVFVDAHLYDGDIEKKRNKIFFPLGREIAIGKEVKQS